MDLAKEWDDYKKHQQKAEKSLKAWDKLKNAVDNLNNKCIEDDNGRIYAYIKRIDVINLINEVLEEV